MPIITESLKVFILSLILIVPCDANERRPILGSNRSHADIGKRVKLRFPLSKQNYCLTILRFCSMIAIMQDPDWNHLKIVLAIARAGSLTGAARHLGVDQTTTGRRLTTLEHQLGKTLFIRAKSGFVPTEDGHIVIEAASKLEADVVRMADALSDAEDGVSGVVRILGNPWMRERFAANGLMSLLARHPNLQIKLSGRLPPIPSMAKRRFRYGSTRLHKRPT